MLNTLQMGLPLYRNRLWIVAIRRDVMKHTYLWPSEIDPIPIDGLLIPMQHDRKRPGCPPSAPWLRNR